MKYAIVDLGYSAVDCVKYWYCIKTKLLFRDEYHHQGSCVLWFMFMSVSELFDKFSGMTINGDKKLLFGFVCFLS